MSLLPQRKKSPEEIAKLREALGIGGPPPDPEEAPVEVPVVRSEPEPEKEAPILEVKVDAPVSPLAPLPVSEIHEPKQVRSLKRSERIPVLPVEENGPPPHHPPQPEPEPVAIASPLPAPHPPKQVRSLRKSEQGPLPVVQPPAPDSKLPIHRHSDDELNRIRRQEAISMLAPAINPQTQIAHLAVVLPGYLFAIAAAACYYFYELEIQFTAGCVAISLSLAAFIFFKKPLSRHHAAFIGVMSLFVIVFGALHYFPQLRHGT